MNCWVYYNELMLQCNPIRISDHPEQTFANSLMYKFITMSNKLLLNTKASRQSIYIYTEQKTWKGISFS